MKCKSLFFSFVAGLAVVIYLSFIPVESSVSDMPISGLSLDSDERIDSELFELLKKGINTHVIWSGNERLNKIALTFDDGPNPKFTEKILKILDEYKVPATFFLIGQHAQAYPGLVKKIFEGGHEIGNHTYSHIELVKVESPDVKLEIQKTRQIIREITGHSSVLFRPPWGRFDNRVLQELALRKFDIVLWSVDSRDWSLPGGGVIKKNILSNVRNGSIIVCHDNNKQIVKVLPKVIKILKKRGYEFVTLHKMIALSMLD